MLGISLARSLLNPPRRGLAPWESVDDPWARDRARYDPIPYDPPSSDKPPPWQQQPPGPIRPWQPQPQPGASVVPETPDTTGHHQKDFIDTKNVRGPTKRLRLPSPPTASKRITRSMYAAVETHGHFGLVDTGEVTSDGGHAVLILHVPREPTGGGYSFDDLHPGDVIHANRVVRGGMATGAVLRVGFVTRHKYYRPGQRVSTCVVGVPEQQWRAFVRA